MLLYLKIGFKEMFARKSLETEANLKIETFTKIVYKLAVLSVIHFSSEVYFFFFYS